MINNYSPAKRGFISLCSLSIYQMYSFEMIDAVCVYVPENDAADTQYIHFYPYEMDEAEDTRQRLQDLYPSVSVRVFDRETSVERIEDERSLR